MATATLAIPYYADDIPCTLPTEEEIEAAPDMFEAYPSRRVVQINEHIAVKFGEGVELAEGENMVFVRQNTKISVPKVYALYAKDNKKYIVMQRITGQTLLALWPQLEPVDKKSITATLRSYFDELRALGSPGYYGSLGERKLLDGMFWTTEPDATINGPFASDELLIEAMARKLVHDGPGRGSHKADFYRQCLPRVLGGHKSTFTHGDFQRKNIMVHKLAGDAVGDAAASPASTQWQITIVVWELSGWYPSYWEYSLAFCALRYDDDWCLWIEKVLDPHVSQSAWMHRLHLELWS